MRHQKRTYFVSVDLAAGATLSDLHVRTAQMMGLNTPQHLRLCLVLQDGHVTFLNTECSLTLVQQGLTNEVVHAVVKRNDVWEEPCVVDFPNATARRAVTEVE